jgi:hypothetical protein
MCAVKYIIPLKGGEGLVSAGIILVERDASRAIEFSSPHSPAACGGGKGGGVVLLVAAVLRHPRVQYLEPLLALAGADDLAIPGASASLAATVLPS